MTEPRTQRQSNPSTHVRVEKWRPGGFMMVQRFVMRACKALEWEMGGRCDAEAKMVGREMVKMEAA